MPVVSFRQAEDPTVPTLAQVEAREEVVIARRGLPVTRLVRRQPKVSSGRVGSSVRIRPGDGVHVKPARDERMRVGAKRGQAVATIFGMVPRSGTLLRTIDDLEGGRRRWMGRRSVMIPANTNVLRCTVLQDDVDRAVAARALPATGTTWR